MNVQPHVVFRGMSSTPALLDRIDEEIASLETLSAQLTSCHVAVERLNHHHRDGLARTRIELALPGEVLTVSREEEDTAASINAAFEVMGRQLRDFLKQRQDRRRM